MTDDTKAPERIWAWPWSGDASRGQWTLNASVGFNGEALYIREDVAQEMVVVALDQAVLACQNTLADLEESNPARHDALPYLADGCEACADAISQLADAIRARKSPSAGND